MTTDDPIPGPEEPLQIRTADELHRCRQQLEWAAWSARLCLRAIDRLDWSDGTQTARHFARLALHAAQGSRRSWGRPPPALPWYAYRDPQARRAARGVRA